MFYVKLKKNVSVFFLRRFIPEMFLRLSSSATVSVSFGLFGGQIKKYFLMKNIRSERQMMF
jgi:hypothetical protein